MEDLCISSAESYFSGPETSADRRLATEGVAKVGSPPPYPDVRVPSSAFT